MAKLKNLWSRLRELNRQIRKRRNRGHKTPDLAAERKKVLRKIAYLKEHPPAKVELKGLVMFDGHQVPSWIVHEVLEPARASGKWKGSVISGYRTPAYSEQLCEHMCGHPSCPGMCAGRATNHACPPDGVAEPYKGAVDVLDPAGLQSWTRSHGNPLIGNGQVLPRDLNHFSREGN